MFQLNDLTQADIQNIFSGLLELPGKVCNPLLQKLDAQINMQNRAMMAKQIEEANKAAGLAPVESKPRKPKTKVAAAVDESVSTPAQGGANENNQD